MRVIAEQAPDVEFHLIEDAGHYAPLEQPKTIAALIGDFLDRRYQPQPTTSATRKAN
jgi:pimeloyl-ACP methyl ester carboxylesterase